MRRAAAIALAALSIVPSPGRAQFRARPMVIPVSATPSSDLSAVLAGALAAAPAPGDAGAVDLLHLRSGGLSWLRAHHALLSPSAWLAQPWPRFTCAAAGRLAENGADDRADVVYCAGALNELQIAFGDAPLTLRPYTHALNTNNATPTVSFARLLPREAGVLVLPVSTGRGLPYEGDLYALYFGAAAGAPPMSDRRWDARSITSGLLPDVVLTMRISPEARRLGIDDLYLPAFGSVTIFAHATYATPPAALLDVDFGAAGAVHVGWRPGLDAAAWLPPGVANNEVLGAAALDVDGDGDLDLVLSLSPSHPVTGSAKGKLLWVERTSDVASLATSSPWHDLASHPDLQPLLDPAVLRAVEIGGEPAVAVFDRGSDSVLVIAAGATPGRLLVWRGGASGRSIHDLRLADLVGSPAADLVADATQADEPAPAILVWPDLGDASPELAWAAGPPGPASRGEDLPVAVAARDPDGPFTVDLVLDDPYGAPAFPTTSEPGGPSVEVAWTVDGARLCGAPPAPLRVTVRATDALGVFDELDTTLDVGSLAPALAVAGAVPPGRLALPPGGTSATLEGSAWSRCGQVAFTWGGNVLAAAASVVQADGATTTRRVLDLPEASYPALLAIDPAATLLATDPGGFASPLATLDLELDARGLVELDHSADAVALAPGEATVIRTRLRSRVGIPLPQVHVVDVLAGLAPAGEPRVSGARLLASSSGGAEVVLEALPPAGYEVVVELPVRSLGDRGSSAVEVRSAGGHLLTPTATTAASDATAPGCGCGGGGAGLEALLALAGALAVRAGRRPRAT